ncbi:DUF2845 domain-containing protein [bacterium]|nr:DUF2845 domain-containing protein [bacterium]
MQEKGLERFEGKWMPTNEVAEIKRKRAEEEYRKSQAAKGMVEYKGKWYTPEEAEAMKEEDANKGLRLGMTQKAVIEKWGEPADKKESPEFKSRQREMWIYPREKEDKEDRIVFEMGTLKEVYVDQEPSL